MSAHLSVGEVLRKIEQALEKKHPYSIVRIGDGENIVMSQDSVWTMKKVLRSRWAMKANQGKKGVTLPDLRLRDQIVQSVRQADVIGILPYNDHIITAPKYLKRILTNKIFKYYNIKPMYTCSAVVNRLFPLHSRFWRLFKGRRILVITRKAKSVGKLLSRPPFNLNVTMTIPFSHYRQLDHTLNIVQKNKSLFDIALISCGVNAVVLAPQIAVLTGKVAIDFGKAPKQCRRLPARRAASRLYT